MFAIGQNKYGDVDVFENVKVDIPKIGEHDILVKNKASAVNPVDTKLRTNRGNEKEELKNKPLILGFDGCGIVEKIGDKVTRFKVGDEVFYSGSPLRSGSNAEYTAVDERIVGKKPKKLNYVEASSVPLCALTAWEGIYELLNIDSDPKKNEGKSILIINGAGGVGSLAIQISKLAGLIVVATASRKETIEFCKNLGADHIISHREDLYEQIKNINELNGGVNYVYNCHNTDDYFEKIPNLLHPSGKALFITGTTNKYPIGGWMGKRLTFCYEYMFSKPTFNYDLESQGKYLDFISELIDEGKLKCTLTKSFPFNIESLTKIHIDLKKGIVIGKLAMNFEN